MVVKRRAALVPRTAAPRGHRCTSGASDPVFTCEPGTTQFHFHGKPGRQGIKCPAPTVPDDYRLRPTTDKPITPPPLGGNPEAAAPATIKHLGPGAWEIQSDGEVAEVTWDAGAWQVDVFPLGDPEADAVDNQAFELMADAFAYVVPLPGKPARKPRRDHLALRKAEAAYLADLIEVDELGNNAPRGVNGERLRDRLRAIQEAP